jgi:predicted esterase YcpF (UPF0227 family)
MHWIGFLFLTLFWIGDAEGKMDLNPPYGSPTYFVQSVFTPDEPDPKKFKNDVLVVFHGLMSAVPNGTYKRIRKQFFKSMTVIGINYDPLDVPATVKFLDAVKKKYLVGRKVTVLGTSLGGYWARYFGNRIGAYRVVLLNPITSPRVQLKKWVGMTRVNTRRKRAVRVTRDQLDAYGEVPKFRGLRPRTLLILSADDKAIDPHMARKKLASQPNVELAWYRTGGHTINLRKHPALARITKFLYAN